MCNQLEIQLNYLFKKINGTIYGKAEVYYGEWSP